MQESSHHMTLKAHLIWDFRTQNVKIPPLENETLL